MRRFFQRCPIPLVALGLIGCGAMILCILSACQASVSAEGGSAKTEHFRKVNTPKRTTVIEETWTNVPGGAK